MFHHQKSQCWFVGEIGQNLDQNHHVVPVVVRDVLKSVPFVPVVVGVRWPQMKKGMTNVVLLVLLARQRKRSRW